MKLLDFVATLEDVPASHHAKGQVGTIVDVLRISYFEGNRMHVSVIFSMLRRAFLIQIPSSRRTPGVFPSGQKPGPSWCSKHLDSGVRRNDEGVFKPFSIPKAFMQSP
jgi:hypothetical protein